MKFEKRMADSAGTPWAGREFSQNSWADDDGSTPPPIAQALAETPILPALMRALPGTRLLVPLLAQLGESEVGAAGLTADKSAELSIVAVATPDGQSAIPAFTSVAEMAAWNPDSRPVPIASERVALAAVAEGHNRVVINPGTRALVLRRTQLAALAQQQEWVPAHQSAEVRQIVTSALEGALIELSSSASEPVFDLSDGDPEATLAGPELLITLNLAPGLNREQLDALLQRFAARLQSARFVELVDSTAFRVTALS